MSTNKTYAQLRSLRDEALDQYLNREEFQYDLDADALYQQYKDRYTQLGKQAMQDTMGQASALTGGYGSSYAQSVGQQAYQNYMQQLGGVVPELYQLAYNRYQDQGNKLYKNYQGWAQLAQQAYQEEQAAQKKQETAQYTPFQSQYAMYEWLSTLLGEGKQPKYDDPTVMIKYNNQNVAIGDVMTMQRVLGQEETGLWTADDKSAAGGMEADTAWHAYQRGQLQNRNSHPLGMLPANVKTMERVLGLEEDGVWSDEDKRAAGNMTALDAWKAYQTGQLSMYRSKGTV